MNEIVCKKCGGPVWDNRAGKKDGTKNPKSPDYNCKDKEGCGYTCWTYKEESVPVADYQMSEKQSSAFADATPPIPEELANEIEDEFRAADQYKKASTTVDWEAKDRGIAILSCYKVAIQAIRDMTTAGVIDVRGLTVNEYMKRVLQVAEMFFKDAQIVKSGLVKNPTQSQSVDVE